MGNMMGGGARKDAQRTAKRQEAMQRQSEQAGNEDEMRARQKAERGGAGRGRDMLAGRMTAVMPTTLGGQP